LAFTVFAFGAVYLLYRAISARRTTSDTQRVPGRTTGRTEHPSLVVDSFDCAQDRRWSLAGSALLTGLMMLQKPASGILIAFGMGVWFLARAWRRQTSNPASLMAVASWSLIALLILSPYVARNLVLFHTPFYSTESLDAWVLGYADDEAIYKVYTPQA